MTACARDAETPELAAAFEEFDRLAIERMGITNLMTPGPTEIPQAIRLAGAEPIVHHRTALFSSFLAEMTADLKYVFRTEHEVLTLCGSGTCGMEAAVVNLVSPGDSVVVLLGGKFSERFVELAEAYGADVTTIETPWGQAVDPDQLERALQEAPAKVKAVFVTHNATSTGVINDIRAIGEVTRRSGVLLVVDSVSGLATADLRTDEWGVDVAVGASHKGLMSPPGLAFVAVSPSAWSAIEACPTPRYYCDLRQYRKSLHKEKAETPFTPAISVVCAVREALKRIREEGLDQVFARHQRMKAAVRAGVRALGLEPFVPDAMASPAVTSVRVPATFEASDLTSLLARKYATQIAGGQEALKGKIIRIAHLGAIHREKVLATLDALEKALAELGQAVTPGRAAAAAQSALGSARGSVVPDV